MTERAIPEPMTDEDRLELERGLRFTHIMSMVNQSQGNEALAGIMALADLLVSRGVISGTEFEEYRARATEQISEMSQPRVRLANIGDKYTDEKSAEIDCASRIHLCHARCCTYSFYLTVQDLEEGVAKWDYGNPYWIKQEKSGYCTHCDPGSKACTIHAQRPHVCRVYDCRNDSRIWIDFEAGIPAPMPPLPGPMPVALAEPDLGRALFSTSAADEAEGK